MVYQSDVSGRSTTLCRLPRAVCLLPVAILLVSACVNYHPELNSFVSIAERVKFIMAGSEDVQEVKYLSTPDSAALYILGDTPVEGYDIDSGAVFVSTGLRVEICRCRTPLDAYSLFTQNRKYGIQLFAADEAIISDSVAVLFKGRFTCLIKMSPGSDSRAELVNLAQKIAPAIPSGDLSEVDGMRRHLPFTGQYQGTLTFSRNPGIIQKKTGCKIDLLGSSGSKPAVEGILSAVYKTPKLDKSARVCLLIFGNEVSAQEVFSRTMAEPAYFSRNCGLAHCALNGNEILMVFSDYNDSAWMDKLESGIWKE